MALLARMGLRRMAGWGTRVARVVVIPTAAAARGLLVAPKKISLESPYEREFQVDCALLEPEIQPMKFKMPSPSAAISPLASRLFNVIGVESVAIEEDRVHVEIGNTLSWKWMTTEIVHELTTFLLETDGRAILSKDDLPVYVQKAMDTPVQHAPEPTSLEEEIAADVNEVVEDRIRPALQHAGGDVVFRGYRNGTAFVHFEGAPTGRPEGGSLLEDVQEMIAYYVDEVKRVEEVDRP